MDLIRESRMKKLWEDRKRQWSEIEASIAHRTGRPIKSTVFARQETYRELEEVS